MLSLGPDQPQENGKKSCNRNSRHFVHSYADEEGQKALLIEERESRSSQSDSEGSQDDSDVLFTRWTKFVRDSSTPYGSESLNQRGWEDCNPARSRQSRDRDIVKRYLSN